MEAQCIKGQFGSVFSCFLRHILMSLFGTKEGMKESNTGLKLVRSLAQAPNYMSVNMSNCVI